MSHIACPGLEASDAKDKLGLVEEDDRSPSLILNLLSFIISLHAAKSDFSSALPSAFLEVGIHIQKIMYDIIFVCSDIIDL